jgi:phage terminase large subunit-like protein
MDYKPEIFDGIDGDVTIRGYFQSPKWWADCERQIRSDFVLRSTDISQECLKMAGKINSVNSIAMHVRMGDYRTEEATQKVMGILPVEYYEEALDVIQKADNQKLHVFLFSDEPEEAMKFLGITRHKHMTVVRGMTDIEDLFLMANCRHTIMANSSFSWWGAWASLKQGIRIAPKKWLVEINSDDLCPPQWIRL